MKKNIIKIGLLSLLSLSGIISLNSCRDAIDIVQDGEITDEVFFSNVNNMQKYLQGSVYTSADYFQGIRATSTLTDEIKIGSANGGYNTSEFRHFLDASNALSRALWLEQYALINNATRLIEGAKRVTASANEQNAYNKILAEARVLRALGYLQLQTYFSEDMTNDNALGVIVLKELPQASTKLSRNTNAEVYAAMEEDLDFAEQYLDQSSRYYASKNLVNAIRARLNLYRGKYSEAKQYAQAVIDNSGLTLSSAMPIPAGTVGSDDWNKLFYVDASPSPYRKMWSDNEQGEVIFAIGRLASGQGSDIARVYTQNTTTFNGSPRWVVGTNLYNILNTTAGDIRRYAYVDPTSKDGQNIIDKYPGKGTAPLRNDVKIFRLSEMYFILAEVAAINGELENAKNYIQKIREARNYLGSATTPNYTSTQEALKDILLERRVELAFEGHRYIDLKRIASKAGVTMDRNEADDIVSGLKNLENGSYKYTLPLPASEFAGNKNVKQNSGYAPF